MSHPTPGRIRRVAARELDPELHPERDYTDLEWINRPGDTAYRFPVHSVHRSARGALVVTFGGNGPSDPRAPQVHCADADRVLIATAAAWAAPEQGQD